MIINGKSTKEFKDKDWDTYRNHSIGFVFQSYNLIPHQSVLANVEIALTLSGVSKSERRERAIKVLEKVGLGDQLYKRPNQMSGGQMQRVAIARALVNDPDIILADEPTGALDTETSIQIMEILKEIAKDKLIIMVTHNPELAKKYSTQLNIYKSDTSDGIVQVNPSQVFNEIGLGGLMGTDDSTGASMVSAYSMENGTDVWKELSDNQKIITSTYDIIQGRLPENYNEIVVAVDQNNQISDYCLYALGVLDIDELKDIMRDISRVFNAETLIEGFVSGILGIGVSLLIRLPINVIVSDNFDIQNIANLPWQAALILIAISMFLTFIAGLVPSKMASKKDPVVALRSE